MGLKIGALIFLLISGLGDNLTGIRIGLLLTGFFIVMDILETVHPEKK